MPRKPSTSKSADIPVPWRRWLLWLCLAAVGLLFGFGVPYVWLLDRDVSARFGALTWQEPTRVFARPLALAPELAMDAATLERELHAASYRNEPDAATPGSYAREGSRFVIASRGFHDVDGEVAPRRVEVILANGRVSSLRDIQRDRSVAEVRLDPARIATLFGLAIEERRLVRLEDVPELLVTGVQAVEDRDFKHHRGVDPIGVLRAMWVNLRAGELRQGASTLTQQLVRGLYLTREKTFRRKFDEALYALIIEARFDKATILEAYLNQVFLGQQGKQAIHGVGAASEFWFARELDSLGTSEIALMIGMMRGASFYDPRRNPERALKRRNLVLDQFLETGLIDAAEHRRASARPLSVNPQPSVFSNRYPAFMDLVRIQLEQDYPAKALEGAGLQIHTTLAPSAQQAAQSAVTDTVAGLARKDGPALQSGLVLTDAHSGEVRALVGSVDGSDIGFNRALEARRPVGSLLKPFVYMLALAQPGKYSLASFIDDAPITVPLTRGRTWQPENIDRKSHGRVRLIEALAKSYNQATVRLAMEIGVGRLVDLLAALAQIQAPNNPSLVLGSVDLSPMAVAQLYQFLASGGEVQPLRAVRGVLDAGGGALIRYDRPTTPAQAGDALATQLIGIALQETVVSGTARGLRREGLGRLDPAGKTGTSNDGRDSWFAGYTGDHLAVVWVGNDRNEATGLFGGTGAMRVWSALFSSLPSSPLRIESRGLEWLWVEPDIYAATDADCEGAQRFPFVAGFGPGEFTGCRAQRIRDWIGDLVQ